MLMLLSGLFRVGVLPDVDEPFSEMRGFHNVARLYIVALLHGYCPQYREHPSYWESTGPLDLLMDLSRLSVDRL
jgi:hypothetical protein